jgi:hypothetical protein
MDKSKVYVQIGAVNPHADSSRVTPHARNFHISTQAPKHTRELCDLSDYLLTSSHTALSPLH